MVTVGIFHQSFSLNIVPFGAFLAKGTTTRERTVIATFGQRRDRKSHPWFFALGHEKGLRLFQHPDGQWDPRGPGWLMLLLRPAISSSCHENPPKTFQSQET